ARRELERLLGEVPGVEVVGSLGVPAQALAALADRPCDLVLLDIQMPGLTGLELAEKILALPSPPHLAFVTAHDSFALKAFDREALDYLLKPAALERLARLIQRVRERRCSAP